MPELKVTEYSLRHMSIHRPQINTDWVQDSYFNRLIFTYNLALYLFGKRVNKFWIF